MKVHKEGRVTLLIVAVFILILNYAVIRIIGNAYIVYPLFAASLVLYFFVLMFFRVVERPVISDDNAIIAPCDGKVVVIEKAKVSEYLQEEMLQISIFMSPFNVHMNWYPVSGKVLYMSHNRGSHSVAWAPKASSLNEHSSVVIETANKIKILVRQIAGAMARRVICYAKEGNYVEQNGNMGFIKFGSRVDVFLPLDAEVKVELNQKVIGTQTLLARVK